MSRPFFLVAAWCLGCASLSASWKRAYASDTEASRSTARPELALVVVGARDASLVHTRTLLRSLQESLGVHVVETNAKLRAHEAAREQPPHRAVSLGLLSVMVSRERTTLLWTTPDVTVRDAQVALAARLAIL